MQSQWELAPHSRIAYKYLKDVRVRFASPWTSDHYETQFVSGYGNFASWLFSRGIIKNERLCDCGSEEFMQQVLVNFPLYEKKGQHFGVGGQTKRVAKFS